MLYVSVIFLIITSTFGENLEPGPCPNVTVPLTAIHKIVGVWYEYSRSCNVGNSFDKCQRLVIDEPVEGSSSSIFESKSLISDANTTMVTNFIMKNDKLHITYHLPTIGNMIRDFTILGVDHDNYCITWHCMEIGSSHIEKLYVFSRQPKTSLNLDELTACALLTYGLKIPEMVEIDHDNCY